MPAQLRRHTVRGQVLDALRSALAAGELEPGRVYSAPALGERFGVSPTPVREAMQQLAAEGAVEAAPNRGFRVLAPSDRDRAELAEVRALLLVPVVLRLAAELPPERWAELAPLTGDGAAFHDALAALPGNAQLARVARELYARARPGPDDAHGDAARRAALLEALAERELDRAEYLLRALLAPTGAAGRTAT